MLDKMYKGHRIQLHVVCLLSMGYMDDAFYEVEMMGTYHKRFTILFPWTESTTGILDSSNRSTVLFVFVLFLFFYSASWPRNSKIARYSLAEHLKHPVP